MSYNFSRCIPTALIEPRRILWVAKRYGGLGSVASWCDQLGAPIAQPAGVKCSG